MSTLITAADVLPTLAEMAGINVTTAKPLDGISVAPLLYGQSEGWKPRTLVHYWRGKTAVRNQQYRLDHQGRLYDIPQDPGQLKAINSPHVAEVRGKVRRAKKIRVRFQDLDLRGREIELSGFVARIFQHEMDHLDGKVFIDRMEPESRQEVEHLLDALRERYMATTE